VFGKDYTTPFDGPPPLASVELKRRFMATVLSEAYGTEKNPGPKYRVWRCVLGDDREIDYVFKRRVNGKWENFLLDGKFKTVRQGCDDYRKNLMRRVDELRPFVDAQFESPESNPFPGWTGQGSLGDLNCEKETEKATAKCRADRAPRTLGLLWNQTRAYWWLQDAGKAPSAYVKILCADPPVYTSVIFHQRAIEQYFRGKTLPKEIPLIPAAMFKKGSRHCR